MKLVRPKFAVPVHGEWRHLSAHAALAKEMGIEPLMLEDGDILSLFPGRPEVIDSAPVGKLALDGNRVVPLQGGVMAARRRMLFNGVVVGSVAVDATGRLMGQARISAPGLFEPEDPESVRIAREFGVAVGDLPAPLRRDDVALLDAAKSALRKCVGKRLGKRPFGGCTFIAGLAKARRLSKGKVGWACRPPQTPRHSLRRHPIEDGGSGGGGTPHPVLPWLLELPALGVFNGFVLFVLIWWTALFAVLPLGTSPVAEPGSGQWVAGGAGAGTAGAQAGADDVDQPGNLAVCAGIIASGWISFRQGFMALPEY